MPPEGYSCGCEISVGTCVLKKEETIKSPIIDKIINASIPELIGDVNDNGERVLYTNLSLVKTSPMVVNAVLDLESSNYNTTFAKVLDGCSSDSDCGFCGNGCGAVKQGQICPAVMPNDGDTCSCDVTSGMCIKRSGNNIFLQGKNSTTVNYTGELVYSTKVQNIILNLTNNSEIKVLGVNIREYNISNITIVNASTYEIFTKKRSKFLGLIPVDVPVKMHINSDDGAIMYLKKPWWSFLAF